MDEYKKIVRDFDAEQKNKKAKQKMRQENVEKRVFLLKLKNLERTTEKKKRRW